LLTVYGIVKRKKSGPDFIALRYLYQKRKTAERNKQKLFKNDRTMVVTRLHIHEA